MLPCYGPADSYALRSTYKPFSVLLTCTSSPVLSLCLARAALTSLRCLTTSSSPCSATADCSRSLGRWAITSDQLEGGPGEDRFTRTTLQDDASAEAVSTQHSTSERLTIVNADRLIGLSMAAQQGHKLVEQKCVGGRWRGYDALSVNCCNSCFVSWVILTPS